MAGFLGAGNSNKRQSFSKYNPIFEFPYTIQGEQVTLVVTSVLGHLMELDFEGQARSWSGVKPGALFDANVVKQVPAKFTDIAKTLKQEAKRAKYLDLWLDCDREGENIAFEVVEVCKQTNPNLTLDA
eukprot:GABV01007850.1.p1 GENE.GABV01007850.1~~GABV01007850.1.p1  ORF type:complete len:128 (-),score=49.29 GABV01007850.1:3-386(-)